MLPDPHHRPALSFKGTCRFVVALPVALQLRLPVPGVGLRLDSVLRATVPEAAIDEHSHPGANEDDIGSSAQRRHGPPVDQVAQPSGMQLPANSQLRSSVLARLTLAAAPVGLAAPSSSTSTFPGERARAAGCRATTGARVWRMVAT
jgi:hypothetical protein